MNPPTPPRLRHLENFDPGRACFGCGRENPHGLRMRFLTDGHRVYSRLRLPEPLCGWEGVAHGGIVTTVLDEIMSWSAIHLLRRLILTRTITVSFLRPVPTGAEVAAEGWIERVVSEREAVVGSALRAGDGKELSRAEATLALLTPAAARKLGIIDEKVIRGFEAHFTGADGAPAASGRREDFPQDGP
jgi:acyl-coenzyme A thioesterase PaaI-like protein